MDQQYVAEASIIVHASVEKVWDALVSPEIIKQYMFGATVLSEWRQGSPIVWRGEWQGKPYEDKGTILKIIPMHTLQYSHFSPLAGKPDLPENRHLVTIHLSQKISGVLITLTQDNNEDKESCIHSQDNWIMILRNLKKILEK